MSDRVRMVSMSTFNNPLIINHGKPGAEDTAVAIRPGDEHTVTEGDHFSTSRGHADDLIRGGLAEETDGDAADPTDAQVKLAGAQTSATDGIATNRVVQGAKEAPTPANKKAADPANK